MVMKKMNTQGIFIRIKAFKKLNADDATKAKIDEISKDGILFLIESFKTINKEWTTQK
jgi:hypothetical protein